MAHSPKFERVAAEMEVAAIRRVSTISPELLRAVQKVQPSSDGCQPYRPCSVALRDGSVIDRAYVAEAEDYIGNWGVPHEDERSSLVDIAEVLTVQESPFRLPPEIADRIYRSGESGMGYTIFQLILRDGRLLDCFTGNAVDFVDLPDDVEVQDIVDVRLQAGAGRTSPQARGSEYTWVLYRDPGELRSS
jgi:hypothetical protein